MKKLFLIAVLLGCLIHPELGRSAQQEAVPAIFPVDSLLSKIGSFASVIHTVTQGDSLSKLAKKYKTTPELLRKSNGITGDRIYTGMKLKIPRVRFSIRVEKRRNHLTLLANGKPLKRYRVATGAGGSTPAGLFRIVNKLENPTWFHAGAVVSPDSPDNILGTRWLGFDLPGYGIHGTTLPETIGTYASKGCIRMLNSDVEEIYEVVPLGVRVKVED